MIFKERLLYALKETRKKEKQELNLQISKLLRTDEEWKIVNEHLENCVIKAVSIVNNAKEYPGLKGRWYIFDQTDCVNFSNPYYAFEKYDKVKANFCQQHKIQINWKDMERFCIENNFQLRYGFDFNHGNSPHFISSNNDLNKYVHYFLVKVPY